MRHPALNRIKGEEGQAAVEFALVASLLVLLLLGIMQFGSLMHAYLSIEYASREGARAGALGKPDAQIASTVQEALPATLDLTRIQTIVTPAPADRRSGEAVTVRVTYTSPIDFPWMAEIIGRDSLTLSGQTVMRIE
jgi:Flp pilus assembly protein TadG